ncbi:unnamed protein product [Periconia digitata]|uniref:Uncharacterized protein n=1 Tax=Periconia digitata TaxID=1303443 RepID=A0A9W4UFV7_9PLEO|nr:unnamed protein product [Periconia digitata]
MHPDPCILILADSANTQTVDIIHIARTPALLPPRRTDSTKTCSTVPGLFGRASGGGVRAWTRPSGGFCAGRKTKMQPWQAPPPLAAVCPDSAASCAHPRLSRSAFLACAAACLVCWSEGPATLPAENPALQPTRPASKTRTSRPSLFLLLHITLHCPAA